GAVERRPLTSPAPSGTPLAAVRARKPLHLGSDAHSLAGGHDRANSRNQALRLGVLEQRTEKLGRAADHGLGVADDHEQLLGPRDGDVDTVGFVEDSDGGPIVRTHQGYDLSVRLSAVECIHRLYIITRPDSLQ